MGVGVPDWGGVRNSAKLDIGSAELVIELDIPNIPWE